ncbi:MAG: ATP-dependent zinc protease [Bdellovibrionales bacterium]|nr:ATP-dependent zinc protease [Bdellovibrionales bacterium]
MNLRVFSIGFSFLFLTFSFHSHCAFADESQEGRLLVLGWLEEVSLYPSKLPLHAKLDTGADTSSLHAENLETYTKNGEEWVRFQVSNRAGEALTIDKKIRRHVRIKRKQGRSQMRPVVKLGICVGGVFESIEFNLVDRSNFSSAVLVGRNFLSGKILVDSAVSYTSEPSCTKG